MPDGDVRAGMPDRPATATHSGASAWVIGLLIFVVFAWGLNWVVMKIVVQELSPLWAVTIRTGIAVVVLIPAVALTGQFVLPSRADLPLVLVVSLFHMTAFAVLMTLGLKYVPAGRAIVLGYTTPLWVAPAAFIFLKEPMPLLRLVGIGLGLVGLLALFDPSRFDWRSTEAVAGNGFILLAALCWSISIVYTRAHRWIGTPFQLIVWQTMLSAIVLAALAFAFEGAPKLSLSAPAVLALVYNGAIGTALGFWAMMTVNKELPATVTSLGVLATPVVGLLLSALILHERIDMSLAVASLLICTGIAIGMARRS
jgi:drug/metabolite transporter (DMT)-like permease